MHSGATLGARGVTGAIARADTPIHDAHGANAVADTASGRLISAAGELPSYLPASEPNFKWGQLSGHDFGLMLQSAQAEIAHWRKNSFLVPSGNVGKDFIRELTSLLSAYAQGSAMESVALTAMTVICVLLLQEPHPASKSRDHVTALERRLQAWRNGDLDGLMKEGRTIQHQLRPFRQREQESQENNSRIFSKLVFEGTRPSDSCHTNTAEVC